MPPDGQTESTERIRELEAQVAQLKHVISTLQRDRRTSSAHGGRIGDPLPKPPHQYGRIWTIRALMLLMTAAIGTAFLTSYASQDLSSVSVSPLGGGIAAFRVDYVLLTCAAAALVSLFVYRKRTLGFALMALLAVYPVFGIYLSYRPASIPMSTTNYAWGAFALLTLWHTLIAILCVMESRRLGRGRRRSAAIATLNSAAYYPLIWYGLRTNGSTHEALVYVALGVLALALAVYAESSGPHRNYLFQIFLYSALALFNFGLVEAVEGTWLVAAMTLECLVLAAAYHGTGIVILKPVNLMLLAATFVVTMQAMKFSSPLYVGSQTIQSNWLQGLFTTGAFLLTSAYYGHLIRSVKPQHRRISGHWFMADTALDVPASTVSLLHAAGAAILLLLLVISDLGNKPALPFILALFSGGLAILGILIRTAQIEVGAVMLIIAAHVSFYFFYFIRKEGFVEQPQFALYTLLLTAYTYVGGYRGERFLSRVSKGRSSDYQASASLPYIVATGSAAALIHRYVGTTYTPLLLGALAVALVLAGLAARATGLKLSAASALFIAAALWFYMIARPVSDIAQHASLPLMAGALIAGCVIVERAMPWRQEAIDIGAFEHVTQAALVLLAGGLGAGTLGIIAPEEWKPVLLFAHAFAWILGCVVLTDSHYRWTALLVLISSAAWLGYRQHAFQPESGLGGLIGCAVVLLLILGAIWFFLSRGNFPKPPRLATGK